MPLSPTLLWHCLSLLYPAQRNTDYSLMALAPPIHVVLQKKDVKHAEQMKHDEDYTVKLQVYIFLQITLYFVETYCYT